MYSLDSLDRDLAIRDVVGHGVLMDVQRGQSQGDVVLELRGVALLDHVVTALLRTENRKNRNKIKSADGVIVVADPAGTTVTCKYKYSNAFRSFWARSQASLGTNATRNRHLKL